MTMIEPNVPVAEPRGDGGECFPLMVVRVAAGPFDDLARLDLPESPALFAEARRRRASLAAVAETLREESFAAVRGCDDGALRRALIAAKRDLFNGRRLDAKTIDALAGAALPTLDAYAAAVRNVDDAERIAAATFEVEVASARQALRALAASEALHRPLVLSSSVFLAQLRRYAARDGGPLSAKELDVERGLLKYLPRMHAKTSPFSTFCHVAVGRLGDLDDGVVVVPEGATTAHTLARINNYVWVMLRPLVPAVPAVADRLPVRVNPTLARTDEELRFLINIRNIESFQSLPALEGLGEIAAMAADSPPLSVLVDRVAGAEIVEGTRDEVRAFIDRLLDAGFLEFDFGVSGTDPDWDRGVVALLGPVAAECPPAAEVIGSLDALREQAVAFSLADSRERAEILRRCNEQLHAAKASLRRLAGLGDEPGPEAPLNLNDGLTVKAVDRGVVIADQLLLYEDSAMDDALVFNRRHLQPIADSLSRLSDDLAFTNGLDGERQQMLHYFLARYGADAVVPLIGFYEDYFRDCKVPEQAADQAAAKGGEPPPPLVYPGSEAFQAQQERYNAASNRWSDALAARLIGRRVHGEQVDVEREDVDAAFAAVPLPRAGSDSTSAFIQLARVGEEVGAVLNMIGPGHGKSMSRFLHLFPPQWTELVRSANLRAAGPGRRLVEVRDASSHNANLHPPLLDCEISSPGAQTSFRREDQLPVTDLVVRLGDDGALALERPSTGERIEVLDLGFQGLNSRSQMFRLLVRGFTRANYVRRMPLFRAAGIAWDRMHGRAADPAKVIGFRPRVVYDGRIVMQRRIWTVPAAVLPLRERGESDAAYFARIDEWRDRNGMPDAVFAFVTRERGQVDPKDSKLQRDDYKPQFISFRNWFCVSVIEKLMSRIDKILMFEEMLPGPEDMLTLDGRRHPMELVIQWSPRPA
jgi:hypothetical protein